jgi:hypothetical protein
MSTLKNLMEGYQPPDAPKVQRSGLSYQQTYDHIHAELERLQAKYLEQDSHDQTSRLIRDQFEMLLRRYHEYCIEQNQGAHYRERGLGKNSEIEFEHVIPIKVTRDAVLSGRLTIDQAFHSPACDISKAKHRELAARGLQKSTPDPYWFWRRYQDLGIQIETRDGTLVDFDTWNLDTHYEYFGEQS